jgi:hypothetical protein
VARRSYLDDHDPASIAGRYRTYNRWYRARNFGVNLAIAAWLAGVLDVMMFE